MQKRLETIESALADVQLRLIRAGAVDPIGRVHACRAHQKSETPRESMTVPGLWI
jgi:hypothetical protein